MGSFPETYNDLNPGVHKTKQNKDTAKKLKEKENNL